MLMFGMFDYKLLEALALTVEEGGFEKAADRLFITQSAVSQRIRQLEEQAGQILITRQNPPLPTDYGRILIEHVNRVRLLEGEVQRREGKHRSGDFTRIPIGVNSDSLATWFLPVLDPFLRENEILIDLKVDDQDETMAMLKNGEVAACVSSSPDPVQGCSVISLGRMDYVMVSSRAFFDRYFDGGFAVESFAGAPAVIFNRKDRLHHRFLKLCFGVEPERLPVHYVPSSEKFLALIEMGLAYGTVPFYQYQKRSGAAEDAGLIELAELRLPVELYWHSWNIHSMKLKELGREIGSRCEGILC